ncbi:MAG: hypothetical protein F6K19_37195 [Cyanothece sp. SIO1E1]|nr:hypothetical protein [Cyanothece sp. SIO1E1]
MVRPPYLPVSFRIDRRVPLVLIGLSVITLSAMILNVGYGEYPGRC